MMLPPTCLLKNAVLGSWCDVIVGFSGNRHATRLGGMFELTMASLRGNQIPPVIFEHTQDFRDLHSVKNFPSLIKSLLLPNGAADKPRRARKPQAFSLGVGLIRVVVRRFVLSKQRIPSATPLSRTLRARDNV